MATLAWGRALALGLGLALGASQPAAAQTPPLPATPPDVESAPAEVNVRGAKPARDAGSHDLRTQDLRDIPGTFGEPFQAIAAMPGVLPLASGLPYFYVRGAPPANTGYFLDGIPVPALFHVGPGPSVVPSSLLDRIEFFPSAAPVRYGRYAGGVIAGSTHAPRDANTGGATGETSVRLFDASAAVESPLDAASTAFVGGRYGYPNVLLSLFAPNLSLAYGDYTARLTRKLGRADAISLFAIGGYDQEHDASSGLVPIDTSFHRMDLRYDHTWASGSLRLATTLGADRTTTQSSTGPIQTASQTSARLRLELAQQLASTLRLSGGADANAWTDELTGGQLAPRQVAGLYAEADYRPRDDVRIVGGVRADIYRSSRGIATSAEPRLAVRLRVARGITTTTSLGVARQPPTYLLPVPGLSLDPAQGLQTTYQYAQGVELVLPSALTTTLTGFYSADRDMSDFASDCGGFAIDCTSIARTDGATYGLELIVRRAFSERLSGWVAYTLARSERRIQTVRFLSPFDRTHVLSAVLRYDFGRGITAGARGTYYTGRPDIPSVSQGGSAITYAFPSNAVPQHRLPAFYRIDVRAEKRWVIGGRRWIAAVLDFFDVTLNPEAIEYQCDVSSWLCKARTAGPIALPSLGVEAGF
jgi:hypothetical protein